MPVEGGHTSILGGGGDEVLMGARRPRSPLASLLGHEWAELESRASSYMLQGRAVAMVAPESPCGGPESRYKGMDQPSISGGHDAEFSGGVASLPLFMCSIYIFSSTIIVHSDA